MGVGRPRGGCGGFQQSKRRCRVGVGVVFASCLFASSRGGVPPLGPGSSLFVSL